MNSQRKFLRPATSRRRGLSLLEVIACTGLVAVMMLPIAGVIRASGQAITAAEGPASTEASLRTGLRWLSDSIRDGQVLGVAKNGIKLTRADGTDVKCVIVDRNLIMTDGKNETIIATDVREIEFQEIFQSSPPNARTGIAIKLSAIDPVSGTVTAIKSITAIPVQ